MKYLDRKWLPVTAASMILILVVITAALLYRSVFAQNSTPIEMIPVSHQTNTPPQKKAQELAGADRPNVIPQHTAPQLASRNASVIQPDQVIQTMKAHYDVQAVDTSCLPYRPEDIEIAKVLEVYDHSRYKVNIISRNKTLDVALIGVTNHTQNGKAREAKAQAEALVKGKYVLLVRGSSDTRAGTYIRYILTEDGLFLNYEVMTYSWPYVSSDEFDKCYPILLDKANQHNT
jgi:hypothetical protein